ncbi:hypothetical protein LTS08_008522 [Lithohypha guttulata]|nr:hypothetical protein LTS08_008522 [Lithohypha guttulata]
MDVSHKGRQPGRLSSSSSSADPLLPRNGSIFIMEEQRVAIISLWITHTMLAEFLLNKPRTMIYGSLAISWSIFTACHQEIVTVKDKRQKKLRYNSASDWLKDPRDAICCGSARQRALVNRVHGIQLQFVSQNALPSPGPANTDSASFLSETCVALLEKHAPQGLIRIIDWRMDKLRPYTQNVPGIFQSDLEALLHSGRASKSCFFLVLRECAKQICSDKRDKIYGLLALLDGHFPVDYSIDVHDLYFRAFRFFTNLEDFPLEPCVMAARGVACSLLDILSMNMSDLARHDPKGRSAFIFLTPTKKRSPDYIPPAIYDTCPTSQTSPENVSKNSILYKDSARLTVRYMEDLSVSCPRCKASAVFSTFTLMNALRKHEDDYSRITCMAQPDFPSLLQCHKRKASGPLHDKQMQAEHVGDTYVEHILLYLHPQSRRLDAVLDRKGEQLRWHLSERLISDEHTAVNEYGDILTTSHLFRIDPHEQARADSTRYQQLNQRFRQ